VQAFKVRSPEFCAPLVYSLYIQIEGNYGVGRKWKEMVVIKLEDKLGDKSCGFVQKWGTRLFENRTTLPIVPQS
jgi:hypothetical protein